jgi:transcriptional regulator with XRE-family HTH domain
MPENVLKTLRESRGLTTRAVAQSSRTLAVHHRKAQLAFSCSWLTRMENNEFIPNIFTISSLSAIYGVPVLDLFKVYGLDPKQLTEKSVPAVRWQAGLLTALGESGTPENAADNGTVRYGKQTGLLASDFWPLNGSQDRRLLYGYIGDHDFTMYPLISPGSIVQIDTRFRQVSAAKWQNQYKRPIYFLELRGAYAFGWCEMQDDTLILLPHPVSPQCSRRFSYPKDIEILGKVTAALTHVGT